MFNKIASQQPQNKDLFNRYQNQNQQYQIPANDGKKNWMQQVSGPGNSKNNKADPKQEQLIMQNQPFDTQSAEKMTINTLKQTTNDPELAQLQQTVCQRDMDILGAVMILMKQLDENSLAVIQRELNKRLQSREDKYM